jgi:hypothetical protein
MRRTVFLAVMSLMWVLGVSAQQHNIGPQKSTLTIHVGKTEAFSGLGHEHEVRAPIHSGSIGSGLLLCPRRFRLDASLLFLMVNSDQFSDV